MNEDYAKLRLLRAAGRVQRFHTQPTSRQQDLGNHTYGVLCLIDHVAPEMTINLWRAALYHDTPEVITGDVPATAKWRYPITLGQDLNLIENGINRTYGLCVGLSEKEECVLKFCDTMELILFSIEEAERGDRNTINVAWNCIRFFDKNKPLYAVTRKSEELYTYIHNYITVNFPREGVLFNDRSK